MKILNRKITAWVKRDKQAFQNTPLSICLIFGRFSGVLAVVFIVSCTQTAPKNAETQTPQAAKEPVTTIMNESTKGVLDSSKTNKIMTYTDKIAAGLLKKVQADKSKSHKVIVTTNPDVKNIQGFVMKNLGFDGLFSATLKGEEIMKLCDNQSVIKIEEDGVAQTN